jgi:hypothetical protein
MRGNQTPKPYLEGIAHGDTALLCSSELSPCTHRFTASVCGPEIDRMQLHESPSERPCIDMQNDRKRKPAEGRSSSAIQRMQGEAKGGRVPVGS